MPRTKSRNNVDTCGDCGALEASWASLNKGILLCTECCSVHRSLGRHISQVKHLIKSPWPGSQQQMLHALNNNGANNIWEHVLLENNSKHHKKKPNSKDSLNIKQEFIKAKHKHLAYAYRDVYETGCAENELGKQLHASVRTPNLEASFRLLASGADPNYFHDEKGNTPLHVAVKNEQKLQIELLLVYGADPSYPNSALETPLDLARRLANKDIARRLLESQYEVTDTFSNFLWMKKPDHWNGKHYIDSQFGYYSNATALAKLQKLPNNVFEELAMDVYDEVDRRETEAIWLSCADTTTLNETPFLPVDSTMSSTRNQGRQKLAMFKTPDLKALIYALLVETQRRENIKNNKDDDPLYDSVASDDDYEQVPDEEEELDKTKKMNSLEVKNLLKRNQVIEQLTDRLKESDSTITELKSEVTQLRNCLKTLQNENFELKSQLSLQNKNYTNFASNGNNGDVLDNMIERNGQEEGELRQKMNKNQRPTSMYETREGLSKSNWQHAKNQNKLNNNQTRNTTQSLYDCNNRKTVLECTEHITRSIQQLCKSIQEPERQECSENAVNVKLSIVKLASNLPEDSERDIIKKMIEITNRLEPECILLQDAKLKGENSEAENHFIKIREFAFHLAKFTKEIVTKYSSCS
ncbi:ARF GTPase-activating protein Git isoform X2 [Aethina tumida]|uniref:ARF GTPase-activating protein Git isoform X2 n=1 Tax=Aethina tumida TaxID=116153 RepID=UPI00096B5823|nr:ARF GTPase-activating protein Git isoform X2 [Aethina tumida]